MRSPDEDAPKVNVDPNQPRVPAGNLVGGGLKARVRKLIELDLKENLGRDVPAVQQRARARL